jgi:hypothetical protein
MIDTMSFESDVYEKLDGWVNQLATPYMPPRVIPEGEDSFRLLFKAHVPQAVMVGKLVRAVSGLRGALLLAEAGARMRSIHRFLNMTYDSYVHGAYETTMELCGLPASTFEMRGHPSSAKRNEFRHTVFLKMSELVAAVHITAAVTSNEDVFTEALQALRIMNEAFRPNP